MCGVPKFDEVRADSVAAKLYCPADAINSRACTSRERGLRDLAKLDIREVKVSMVHIFVFHATAASDERQACQLLYTAGRQLECVHGC